MSMHPQEISPVPEETARVAQAANPHGNTFMRMRDELGSIYTDQMFAVKLICPRNGVLNKPREERVALPGFWQPSAICERCVGPLPHHRRGHQGVIGLFTTLVQIRDIVVLVAQHKPDLCEHFLQQGCFDPSCRRQGRSLPLGWGTLMRPYVPVHDAMSR